MKLKIYSLVLLAFLISACSVNAAISTNEGKVAISAAEIADFDLPNGFRPEFSANYEGYLLVSYDSKDGQSHLILIQSDKEADSEKLASMVGQIAPGSYDPQTGMEIVETRTTIVRDQEVTMYITEGVTPEGDTYRQMVVAFQGNGGPALVMLSEPVAQWNQELVDAFVASIR